jgi:hypothetical protein
MSLPPLDTLMARAFIRAEKTTNQQRVRKGRCGLDRKYHMTNSKGKKKAPPNGTKERFYADDQTVAPDVAITQAAQEVDPGL